jgi:hypothetical protein
MTGRPEEIGERIRDLTVRFGAEIMRTLQRYNELLQRFASGELDETAARDVYAQFLRDESARYFRSVTEMGTGYYDALLELTSIYNPPFFEQVFHQARRTQQSPSRPHGGIVELRGSLGDEAVSAFRIDNASDHSEEISFVVSEFSGPPGTAPFRPPLRLQPPRFVLAPSQSQVVTVCLPLVSGVFVPDQRYTALLTTHKRDAFDMTIDVFVNAASPVTVRQVPSEGGSQ